VSLLFVKFAFKFSIAKGKHINSFCDVTSPSWKYLQGHTVG
jgi:hypothetical protein